MTQDGPPATEFGDPLAWRSALGSIVGPGQVTPLVDESHAWDFGQLHRSVPRLVVKPRCAEEVGEVLELAGEGNLAVTSRGTGHSMNGQSLSRGGLLLLLDGLRGVSMGKPGHADAAGGEHDLQDETLSMRVAAGERWRRVAVSAHARGRTPLVLTENHWSTVGGTLSVGGLGLSSHRWGAQTDTCLRIQVATMDGRVRWCSAEENQGLFDAVRAGLGQFGVLTAVDLLLREALDERHVWNVATASISEALDVLSAAARDPAVVRVGAYFLREADGRAVFTIEVTCEEFEDRPTALARMAGGSATLRGPLRLPRESWSPTSSSPVAPTIGAQPIASVRPWIDAVMPWHELEGFLGSVKATSLLRGRCVVALWPLSRSVLRTPLFVLPEGQQLMGVSVLPEVPRSERKSALREIAALSAEAIDRGGKRYLSGWFDFDRCDWERHFGRLWSQVVDAKRRYDPKSLLHPGLLPPLSDAGSLPA